MQSGRSRMLWCSSFGSCFCRGVGDWLYMFQVSTRRLATRGLHFLSVLYISYLCFFPSFPFHLISHLHCFHFPFVLLSYPLYPALLLSHCTFLISPVSNILPTSYTQWMFNVSEFFVIHSYLKISVMRDFRFSRRQVWSWESSGIQRRVVSLE
jgi:hypothetical protein